MIRSKFKGPSLQGGPYLTSRPGKIVFTKNSIQISDVLTKKSIEISPNDDMFLIDWKTVQKRIRLFQTLLRTQNYGGGVYTVSHNFSFTN